MAAAEHFLIEHQTADGWRTVARAIRSTGPYAAQMAVAHAANERVGLFRATPLDDHNTKGLLFDVPSWGPPVPVEE